MMGMGKSLQALAYLVHSKKKKTLIICPASVKYVWEAEVEKWTKLKPYIVDSKTSIQALNFVLQTIPIQARNVIIINYDILKKFSTILRATHFDCLVCDEFHYIKSLRAQRTKEVLALAPNINSILLLSGTPLLSRPVELFTGLK